jgi:hypothetical protein
MHPQTNMQQESSMLNWYPKIKNILPVPKTTILHLIKEQVTQLIGLLDGKEPSEQLKDLINLTAEESGYPIFLRTDQGSAKHDFKDTCFVKSKEDLLGNISGLMSWSICHDLYPRALVFREFLPLASTFQAFRGCLPIARERRYFVDRGEILCHHPYWPEGAINHPSRPDWAELLKELNRESKAEVEVLSELALKFNKAVPGFFSVDFAQDVNGKWYIIDAARGELSWHPVHIRPDDGNASMPRL